MADAGVEQGSAGSASLSRRLRRGLAIVGVLLVAVYAVMLATAGGAEDLLARVTLEPGLLFLPFVSTFLSYLTMSLSYEGIVRAAGVAIRSRDMLRITFIANVANYVLPSGGLSGFALRMVFFTKRGISAGKAVAISFTQTLLTNLMLIGFIGFGLVHLISSRSLSGPTFVAAVALTVGLAIVLVISLLMLYRRGIRARILAFSARLCDRVLDATGYHKRFARRAERLFLHLDEGMELFALKPSAMIAPSAWIFLDWLFMIGTLYLGFHSTGYPIDFGVVTIAFSVSIVLAIVSFVPGGAGVLDGALAATFAGLGVSIKDSLLPIFLYRVCYFVVPALLSLLLARGAFADADPTVTEDIL